MEPDQAHFLLHRVLLPSLTNEPRITRSIIEAIPPDKGDYRPDGVSKSALDLAWHIVATEMRFLDSVAAGRVRIPCGRKGYRLGSGGNRAT